MDSRGMADYLRRGHGRIEGWFDKGFVSTLLVVDAMQRAQGVAGNVCEIGVFRGASFIPLALLTRPGEPAVAVDCFDLKDANRTGSGKGATEEAFHKNLRLWAPKATVVTHKADSFLMKPEDFPDSPFRIVSIDGDHSMEGTVVDLRNALALLTRLGVIVLDDPFNMDWPGVNEGLHDFMLTHAVRAVALGRNKVVICKDDDYDALYGAVTDTLLSPRWVNFYGKPAARI